MATWYKAGTGMAINGANLSHPGANAWRTAYGSKEITSGIHNWKFKVMNGDSCTMFGITSNTKYIETCPWSKSDTFCYMYYGANGHIYDKQGNKAYSETFAKGDEIGVYVDLNKQCVWFTKNGKHLGNARTDINKDATYRLTVSLAHKNNEVKFISYNGSEEQKEETKEQERGNNISKSTEFIVKECKYLENELSNNKIQGLDVKGLSATSNYFNKLHQDIDKLKIELAKCESQLSQRENVLKQRMSVDVGNYKNWSTNQIELYINGLENGRYSKYVSGLLAGFASDGVTAKDLPLLDQGILRQFGVRNFSDNNGLKNQFKKLGAGNEGGNTC